MMFARFAVVLSLFASVTFAQEYPVKPIRFIVPYPAGGVTDIAARLVAPKMGAILGQTVIVENLPGAGGVVATNALARMAPDGYNIGVVFDSFPINQYLYKGVTHDPLKDFAPISLMVRSTQLLMVHPSKGIRNIAELIQMGKEKNKVFFATPGAASSSRLSAELLKDSAGIDITMVFYKGGAPALNDLLGGQVTGMIASMSPLITPHVQAGKLIAIGVSSPKRHAQFPQVPSISDTLPGFEVHSWTGMVAPAGTPTAILDKLHNALLQALNNSEVRGKLTGTGAEVVGSTRNEFADFLVRESSKWGKIIKDRGITVD